MKTITKLLVANRGEIALRILQTARRMGLSTVAVFSKADLGSPHVKFADEAVCIGPAPATESYLQADKILEAAQRTGSEAIHPGYGFLSENADFAQSVTAAGLIFVGPHHSSIRAMGLKREAKAFVAQHGVPVVPGFDGGDQRPETLMAAMRTIGFPIILKPSAGGGGKGMKVVRSETEMAFAIESAQREALAAFGNGDVIIEKYLEKSRHIEVQVFGDLYGQVVHLFERECSIQRRHQKLVEESPSTALTPRLRDAMTQAAVAAAKSVNYVGAGTVEFMLDAQENFYFSEMNTRLQVEHRVTELVTGLDLVEWQLRVSRGEPLPLTQNQIVSSGHAVEVRLCAEGAAPEFLPCVGRITHFEAPTLGHVVFDSGVRAQSEVSVHYDSMLAKLVAWGENRVESTARACAALNQLTLQGVVTNQVFLGQLLSLPAYVAGSLHTQFIAEHAKVLVPKASEPLEAVAAALFDCWLRKQNHPLPSLVTGFRNNRSHWQQLDWVDGSRTEYLENSANLFSAKHHLRPPGSDALALALEGHFQVVSCHEGTFVLLTPEGLLKTWAVSKRENTYFVGQGTWVATERFPAVQSQHSKGNLMSPMPGKVLKVLVQVGEVVVKNQPLLVLEAMKMEQTTRSPQAGTVTKLWVREGEQVTAGKTLIQIEEPIKIPHK
jgi:3-methylcrotonyl-CoA carboxylase alpha subunit